MDDLKVDSRHVIPAHELEVRAARSSGPGGQGVNTTESAVELRWDLEGSEAFNDREKDRIREQLGTRVTDAGVFIVRASEHRSQHRNREDARHRLKEMLREAIRPRKTRRATKPSRAAKRRRLEEKRQRGELKRLRKPPDA